MPPLEVRIGLFQAGDRNPSPGRVHMPQSNQAGTLQLLSLSSRVCRLQPRSPSSATIEAHAPRDHAPQQETPLR